MRLHASFRRHALALGLAGAMFAHQAQAALIDMLDGTVIDTSTGLMWTKSASMAPSVLPWETAVRWADELVYAGYDDWRLPVVRPMNGSSFDYAFSNNGSTDQGFNITSPASELSYLFYVSLGNQGYCVPLADPAPCVGPPLGWTDEPKVGPFTGVEPLIYWSGTAYGPDPENKAWGFHALLRGQFGYDHGYPDAGAFAVRSLTTPGSTPEPGTLALTGLALAVFGVTRVRRRCAGIAPD